MHQGYKNMTKEIVDIVRSSDGLKIHISADKNCTEEDIQSAIEIVKQHRCKNTEKRNHENYNT